MPPKRMKPELMWAAVRSDGRMATFPLWDRKTMQQIKEREFWDGRIVRVRVMQYKPRKRHAP